MEEGPAAVENRKAQNRLRMKQVSVVGLDSRFAAAGT
jgi:hypothetical protein